jgi:hypothetical protein
MSMDACSQVFVGKAVVCFANDIYATTTLNQTSTIVPIPWCVISVLNRFEPNTYRLPLGEQN